jgi:hypothetical protein
MEQWWLLGGDRKPVGPMTTDLLLEGIVAGKVPRDSLVCIVGGTEWQTLGDIAVFSPAAGGAPVGAGAANAGPRRRAGKLLELEERTIVDGIPLWPAEPTSEVEPVTSTLRQQMHGLEDPEERTLVDSPFRPSDPSE